MKYPVGAVVVSLRGKDKGRLMMVSGGSENRTLVCDGRKRKLISPKLKNPRHLGYLPSADVRLEVNAELTDGKLRRELSKIAKSLEADKDLSDKSNRTK